MGISSGGWIQHQWAIPSGDEIENQNGSHKYHLWYDKPGINQSHTLPCQLHVPTNSGFNSHTTYGPRNKYLYLFLGSDGQRHNNSLCMHACSQYHLHWVKVAVVIKWSTFAHSDVCLIHGFKICWLTIQGKRQFQEHLMSSKFKYHELQCALTLILIDPSNCTTILHIGKIMN